VADGIGLGKNFTLVAAAMICNPLNRKDVLGLPLPIFRGNTLYEWVNMAHNDFPGVIGEEQELYPWWRQISVPRRLSEIQTTPLAAHPAHTSALGTILVVTMPGVAEMFRSVIDEMTHGTEFKLVNLLHVDNANLTHNDLNTNIDEPEKPMEYSSCFIRYHNMQSDTIK